MKHDWRTEEFRRLVAFGESTTAGGWSTSRERCWASLLAALINDFQSAPVALVNAGAGANVVSTRSAGYPFSGRPAASERLDRDVIAHQPDLLVVSYGLNDARGGTPPGIFREELVVLIRRVRAALAPVIVLVGPTYMWDFRAGGAGWDHADLSSLVLFNGLVAEVAEAEECLYADALGANGHTDWMVHYDGVHANDLGHRIIANCIFQTLAQHCSCLANRTRALERTSPRWRDESVLMLDHHS